jgi:hypothetical protein
VPVCDIPDSILAANQSGTDTAVILAGVTIHRLQAFVRVNPLSHVADAARDLMNNTGGGGPVAWSLIGPGGRCRPPDTHSPYISLNDISCASLNF